MTARSNGHRKTRLDALTEVASAARSVVAAIPAGGSLPRLRLPSLRRLQRDLPNQAMMATGQLAMTLRDLTGRDVIDLETLQDVIGLAYRIQMVRGQHRRGEWTVDEFGFDREWAEIFLPIFRLIYRKYWRVDTSGLQHIPRRGGALLVSNHAGVLPLDGAMIKVAVHEATDRHARALIATFFGGLPAASWFLRRTGQTLGHPDDSRRLLDSGELVLVFPEGVRGTGKPWNERYQLRRFGRGGFVAAAIRSQVPIIPISVVGSEETYPMLADVKPLADLLGMPYFPITPTWPLLGPLGLVPLPSKWSIRFHEPVRTDEMSPERARDPAHIMAVSDGVRDVIRDGIARGLMERVRPFRG
ncbi:MAG: lysophospholipid acyltransferase family protein [Candidatus Dormibacteria bacterium]